MKPKSYLYTEMTLFTHLFVVSAVLKLLPIFIANMYINIFNYGCDLKPQL